MEPVGYSEKPLIEKLGYQEGESIVLYTDPAWFARVVKEAGVKMKRSLPATHVHIFAEKRQVLENLLQNIDLGKIEKSLWISWPKKRTKSQADIHEETLREIILPLGWVDVKVVAVDTLWSGLKFLRRKKK